MSDWEWFEVYNTTDRDSLVGLTLTDESTNSLSLNQTTLIGAGLHRCKQHVCCIGTYNTYH